MIEGPTAATTLECMGRRPRRRRAWLLAEGMAWVVATVSLLIWAGFYVDGKVAAHRGLGRFEALRAGETVNGAAPGMPDLSQWDAERIVAWRAALAEPAPPALAVLRIPKIGLEVPVLPGTDDFVLNLAVGHIPGTALPGTDGNSAIAGHRDGYFRRLKDIVEGDAVEVDTLEGKRSYRVERTWIVQPEDVSVLDDSPVRSLTLVTCFPFYFVGSAPQRFIVRAVSADGSGGPDAASR
jgi:sortase A